MVLLYHYTDSESLQAIIDQGRIRKSVSLNTDGRRFRGDAAYGEGVYLTSIRPTTNKYHIMLNNYDGQQSFRQMLRTYGNRVQCCIEIDSNKIPGVEQVSYGDQDRDVWLYRGRDLILGNTGYQTYRLD